MRYVCPAAIAATNGNPATGGARKEAHETVSPARKRETAVVDKLDMGSRGCLQALSAFNMLLTRSREPQRLTHAMREASAYSPTAASSTQGGHRGILAQTTVHNLLVPR